MKVKQYLGIIALVFALPMISCGSSDVDDAAPVTNITVSSDELSFTAASSSQTFTLSADHEWGVLASTATWLHVSPTSGIGSQSITVTVSVDANPNTSPRTTSLVFAAGTARTPVTVRQVGATTAKYDAPEGYDLVWHDEFDGNSLGSDWTEEEKPAGWVNSELQT